MKIEEASLAEGGNNMEKSSEGRGELLIRLASSPPRCSTGEKSGMKTIRGLLVPFTQRRLDLRSKTEEEGRERGSYSMLLTSQGNIFFSRAFTPGCENAVSDECGTDLQHG